MGIDIVSWRLGAAPAYAGGGGLRSGADLVVDRLDVVPPGPLLTPPPSSPEDPRSRAESDLLRPNSAPNGTRPASAGGFGRRRRARGTGGQDQYSDGPRADTDARRPPQHNATA